MNWKRPIRKLNGMTSWIKVSHFCACVLDCLLISLKVVTKVAPWIQRASDIKAEVVVNHELEHKIQQHNEEIIKLIKDIRFKVKYRKKRSKTNPIIYSGHVRTKHFKNPMSKSVYLKREWKLPKRK